MSGISAWHFGVVRLAFDIGSGLVFNSIRLADFSEAERNSHGRVHDLRCLGHLCVEADSISEIHSAEWRQAYRGACRNRECGPPWLPTARLSHFLSRACSLARAFTCDDCALLFEPMICAVSLSGIGSTQNANVTGRSHHVTGSPIHSLGAPALPVLPSGA